MIQMLKL